MKNLIPYILFLLVYPFGIRAQLQLNSAQITSLITVVHADTTDFEMFNAANTPNMPSHAYLVNLDRVDLQLIAENPLNPGDNLTYDIANKSATRPNAPSLLYVRSTNRAYAYQPKHFGMFCRIESKIEKKSKISPRFRLGSSDYVDMLEGKNQ